MSSTKTTAIILAAGQGKRMNSNVPKQYLILEEKPILYYTILQFEMSDAIDEIVLVVGQDETDYCKKNIIEEYNFSKVVKIVQGGKERYHSVYNALNMINDSNYVLIHDGARPFVNQRMIQNIVESVKENKACIIGVPVKDTIKIVDKEGFVGTTPARETMWSIQTPQAFDYKLIKQAYDKIMPQKDISVTDDAMVLELTMKYPIKIVEGDYKNIKITTPEDIEIAQQFLMNM